MVTDPHNSQHLSLLTEDDVTVLEHVEHASRLIMLRGPEAPIEVEEPTVKPAPPGWKFAKKHGRTDVLTRLRPRSSNPTMECSDADLRGMAAEQSSAAFDSGTVDQTVMLADPQRRRLSDVFELTHKLGEGGHGTVYLGKSRIDGNEYAIKIFTNSQARAPEYRKRIFREARIASSVDHPNVVKVMGLGVEEEGTPFIVMEYLRGETLANLLHRKGRLDVRLALFVILEACRGLEAAHELGVVHRDIKPANIFLTTRRPRPEVKILDFGVAKSLDELTSLSGQSGPDHMHGTPQYVSPEYCRGEPTDRRSDVYAMAIVTYEMMTGKPPFDGRTVAAILRKHVEAPPVPLRGRTTPSITPTLEEAILIGLAKDPRARYQTAYEFAKALVEGFRRKPVATGPVVALPNHVDLRLVTLERHQRWLMLMLMVALCLLCSLIGVLFLTG